MNIYLIQQDGTNYFKIGITKKDPNIRLKELQLGSGIKLNLIHCYPTKYNFLLESGLHAFYNLKRINSEWFELEQLDVDNFFNTCKQLETSFYVLKDNPFFKC